MCSSDLGADKDAVRHDVEPLQTTKGQSISEIAQRTFSDQKVAHGFCTDQVIVNDPVEVFTTGVPVPIPPGVHECDRAGTANSQAPRLGAQDRTLHVHQSRFTQAPLKVLPGLLALLERSTFSRADTQEDVPARIAQMQAVNDTLQFV